MEFSPEKYMEWLQAMADAESKLEYSALKQDPPNKELAHYHRGRKEAFHEAQLMCAGNGPCYVCKNDKAPYPELATCLFCTLVRGKMKAHLKKAHEMEYKKDEMIDEFHMYKIMKEA